MTDWYLGHFRKSEYPANTPWVGGDFFRKLEFVEDPTGALPDWPPTEEKLAELRKQITEHQETYAKGERAHPVMWWGGIYPNDPDWWEYLRFWIGDKYVREYGANTCYIDVLGCGGAKESFDPRRGHNGDGSYGMGKYNIETKARHQHQQSLRYGHRFGI